MEILQKTTGSSIQGDRAGTVAAAGEAGAIVRNAPMSTTTYYVSVAVSWKFCIQSFICNARELPTL